jgi:hypothetical protein
MDLDMVAERFALDTVFYEYPFGATVDDLAEIASACESFFESDEWILEEDYQPYAYISAHAILSLVDDKAYTFKSYYEMVGK